MSDSLISKWDKRYQNTSKPNSPAAVLLDNRHLLPCQGKALELACGTGGNALLLAEQGLEVDAWDISQVAIAKVCQFAKQAGLQISAQQQDIEQSPPPANRYDLICVTAYLNRTICPAIATALRPGGLLFYQTFTQQKVTAGGPSNPQFLLQQGELLKLFDGLQVIAYHEAMDLGDIESGLRNQAYLVARKTP